MVSRTQRRILLVDDEAAIRSTLKTILEMSGAEVETAGSAREAQQKLERGAFHLIITDMSMESDHAGFDVIRAAHQQSYEPVVAILSASPIPLSQIRQYPVHAIFAKGVNVRELLEKIEVLLSDCNHVRDKHRARIRWS